MPKPPEVPPPLPDIEQMADWIIKHKDVSSKTPEGKEAPHTKAEDQPETYFERRHEVKEELPNTPDPNIKPMIPIAHVLQTRSLLPEQQTPSKRATSHKRRYKLVKPSNTQYASAVLQGFGTAIILIILTSIFLVIKALS